MNGVQLRLLHPDDWAPSMALSTKLRAGEIPLFHMEQRYIRKDGTVVWADSQITVLRDKDGRLIHTIGWVQDITNRKRVEEELHRENQFRSAIVERASEGLCVSHGVPEYPYVQFTIWNPRMTDITGYTMEEINRLGWYQSLYPDPEVQARAQARMDRMRQGNDLLGEEWEITNATGEQRVVSISTSVLESAADSTHLLALIHDITERKRAEEAIARERTFSDDIINSLPGIFYMYDDKGKLVRWNKKHEEMTSYSSEEMLGMYVLDWFSEEHKQYILSRVQSVFAEGESFAEAPLLIKNGSQIPYFFTGRLAALDGQQYLLGVGIDITERKRAEEEKDALQAQLMQAQKMESVGRLAGGVAHDFNNMLTAILGHAQLAMMKCTPSEPIHPHLKEIEEAALRSADFVRQLLAFARKQTVAPKVLDLNDSVAGMLKMLLRLIGEDIDLVWMPGAGLWPVKIDPSQIDQLLANLCVNARDAIAGVGKVTIETEKTAFDEAYCTIHSGFICGEYVMLAVSDDGCGMNKDVIDHLFEPFFTTKEVGKGTGLGLATVYGIVKQNEGFINVYSEPGKGSTFKIYLPRFAGEALERRAASAVEMPRGSGETVLLVEDEAVILTLGQEILEELGYRVLTAGTPGEALRQAKAHAAEIQLLITDVVMPEMNGRDLAKLIRDLKPGLKCLFTSGYTADVIAHRGVLEEGVHFMHKPFSMKDLASKVRETLERE